MNQIKDNLVFNEDIQLEKINDKKSDKESFFDFIQLWICM